jgi:DNA-binding GntR family transcriptional regulator
MARSLADEAYVSIRDEILRGQLRPGMPLSRRRLARQMIERKHVLILNWLFDVTGRRTALPPGFHAELADALGSGDPDKADAVMRAHVRYGLAEIAGQIGALEASEWRERRVSR